VPSEKHPGLNATSGIDATALLTRAMDHSETAGALIGRYHLLQKIGEGGMGGCGLPSRKNRSAAAWL